MKKQKNPLSIRIIYWVTQVIYWLVIAVGFGVLAFNVLVYTSFFGDDLQLHVQLPVKVNFCEEGSYMLNGNVHKAELVEATTKVHFINTPMSLARKYGSAMLIAFLFLIYLFFIFRRFITNVYQKRVFDVSNVELLQQLAYGLLAFWIFAIIYSRVAYKYLGPSLEFEHAVIVEEYRNFAGILMLALFTWVLSHIFKRGVDLQNEQNLTV